MTMLCQARVFLRFINQCTSDLLLRAMTAPMDPNIFY
jgi:hypothetical protein